MKIPPSATLSGTIAIAVISLSIPALAQEEAAVDRGYSYGAGLSIDRGAAVTVSAVFENSALQDTTILVGGTIADVCTAMGCWLVVTDGKQQMRVTFKDHKFFVPKDSHNRRVLLQGIVSHQEIDEETAKHYAGEASKGPKPEEITGTQRVVTMEATGVVIME